MHGGVITVVGHDVTNVVKYLLEAAVAYCGVMTNHVRSTRGTMSRDVSTMTTISFAEQHKSTEMMSCVVLHQVPQLRRAATIVMRWETTQELVWSRRDGKSRTLAIQ